MQLQGRSYKMKVVSTMQSTLSQLDQNFQVIRCTATGMLHQHLLGYLVMIFTLLQQLASYVDIAPKYNFDMHSKFRNICISQLVACHMYLYVLQLVTPARCIWRLGRFYRNFTTTKNVTANSILVKHYSYVCSYIMIHFCI